MALCNGISGVVFTVALCLYWATAGNSVAYWDCPEYVTVASLLEVGHPPGNPLWALTMHVAVMFFPIKYHAFVINLCSGFFMALAAMLLARIIYILIRSVAKSQIVSVAGAGGGALSFALCGSAWFSAVEAEVYAMSAFFTTLVIYLMLLRCLVSGRNIRRRLIVLTAYLIGLSVGVHQLGLLVIPVLVFIGVYDRYRKITSLTFFLALASSFALIGVLLVGLNSWLPWITARFELWGVNSLTLFYGSGFIITFFILSVLFFISFLALPALKRKGKAVTTAMWCVAVILIGFSCFLIIPIRAGAYPPINEGVPDNPFSFQRYLAREQYGSNPLLYGPTPLSGDMMEEQTDVNTGEKTYHRYLLSKRHPVFKQFLPDGAKMHRSGFVTAQDSIFNHKTETKQRGYLLADYSYERLSTPELNAWFPRIIKGYPLEYYTDWSGVEPSTMQEINISETIDSAGRYVTKMNSLGERPVKTGLKPTPIQHLRYFLTYQLYYMYLRYLGWNFIGRQNDIPSSGEIDHGNIVTGISPIDNMMLGPLELVPDEEGKGNNGRNVFFAIPFLLGIAGFGYLFTVGPRGMRVQWITILWFLMTGLAIVVYLNQGPLEPRERDYSFLGSYMAFSVWIGFGIAWMGKLFSRVPSFNRKGEYLSIFTALFPVTLLAIGNYDDNDRKSRTEPLEFASGILDKEEPSIIFSYGDNTTFPLWYAQEVEGKGTRHTLLDMSYLSSPEYLINLMKQGDKGLKLIAKPQDIAFGRYGFVSIPADTSKYVPELTELLTRLYSTKEGNPAFPYARFKIMSGKDTLTFKLKEIVGGSSMMTFRQLMLLDILASYHLEGGKDIYFLYPHDKSLTNPLSPITEQGLFGDILTVTKKENVIKEEIEKILREDKYIPQGYLDHETRERVRRRRGTLVKGMNYLLEIGEPKVAGDLARHIERHYPYSVIAPGSFSSGDSVFYEGIEYALVLEKLERCCPKEELNGSLDRQKKILWKQADGWMQYYLKLSPGQRNAVSASTRRILSQYERVVNLKNR